MNNWLLIIVGVIFLLCMINGGIKGFFKIAISLLSAVLTIVIVSYISPYVQEAVIKYTVLDEIVEEKCLEVFMPKLTLSMLEGQDLTGTSLERFSFSELEEMETLDWEAMGMSTDEVMNIVGEFTQEQQIALVEESTLPQFVKDLLLENNNSAIYEELGVTYFAEYVAGYMSNLVVEIVSFLLTFLLAFIIVKALSAAIDIIGELPVIGALNHAGGAVFGIIQGLLIVWILFLIITIACTTEFGKECFRMIEESQILTILYDTNFLLGKILQF